MARDEDELAILGAVLAPLQVMRRPGGLAVLVGPEEADVEVVAGILEVVRIAAEKRRGEFGGEDQADVGVFLEGVEMVLPALIERDHVAAQAGLVGRFLLDLGHRLPPGLLGRGVVQARREAGVDPRGDVLDADQYVQLEIGRLGLLVIGLGEEAVAVVVLFLGAELCQRIGADVMVGHDQPVGRDERPRAAVVESHRRRAEVLGPAGRRLEAVPGLEPVASGRLLKTHIPSSARSVKEALMRKRPARRRTCPRRSCIEVGSLFQTSRRGSISRSPAID